MSSCAAAGAAFLLAVLWFDLMFDVQVLGHGERELPDEALASIARYYRRVTTTARPMNLLIAFVMLATLSVVIVEIAAASGPAWVGWASLAATVPPIVLARTRTVPNAVRLGARRDPPERQQALARVICREHLASFCAILTLLVLQLALA